LIDALVSAGARTIVFDIVFDTESDAEHNGALQQAIARAGNVILASDRAETADRAYSLDQWVDPIPRLAAGAAGVGAATVSFDPDGAIRRSPLIVGDRPTLALAAAMRSASMPSPADAERSRLILFRGPPRQGIVTVSYYQVLRTRYLTGSHLTPPSVVRNARPSAVVTIAMRGSGACTSTSGTVRPV
jgi:hypothetical protein